MTKQSQFSLIIGVFDGILVALLGAPVSVSFFVIGLTYAASLTLFYFESIGKLWKE